MNRVLLYGTIRHDPERIEIDGKTKFRFALAVRNHDMKINDIDCMTDTYLSRLLDDRKKTFGKFIRANKSVVLEGHLNRVSGKLYVIVERINTTLPFFAERGTH